MSKVYFCFLNLFGHPPCVDIKSSVVSLAFLTLVVAFWQLQAYGSLLTASHTSASAPCTLLATTAAMDLASPDATSGTTTNTNQPPLASASIAASNAALVRLAKAARLVRSEDTNKH
jgi:galactan beta-1,4-galactosyltransferase